MKQLKGRNIQLNYLIKSAVARRYYQGLNREYNTEGARKQFNQDMIDLDRLEAVIREVLAEEIEQLKQFREEHE